MTIQQLLKLDTKTLDNNSLLFVYAQCEKWYSKSIPLYYKDRLFLKIAEVQSVILDRMRNDWNDPFRKMRGEHK